MLLRTITIYCQAERGTWEISLPQNISHRLKVLYEHVHII